MVGARCLVVGVFDNKTISAVRTHHTTPHCNNELIETHTDRTVCAAPIADRWLRTIIIRRPALLPCNSSFSNEQMQPFSLATGKRLRGEHSSKVAPTDGEDPSFRQFTPCAFVFYVLSPQAAACPAASKTNIPYQHDPGYGEGRVE